jgi:hypothetical protein
MTTTTEMEDPSTRYEALAGEADRGGTKFQPGGGAMAEGMAAPEVHFGRPSRYRYPIGLDEFKTLKDSAHVKKDTFRPRARTLMDQAAIPLAIRSAAPVAPAPAKFGAGFAGIPATGWLPYDCAIAVGKNHVMCAVNSSVAAFDRSGTRAFQTTLTVWFKSVLPATATIFDPRLTYDAAADKYILVAVANNNDNQQSWFLISVSQSGDPTASWWSYVLDATVDGNTKTNNWADYPGLGQDASAVYLTANMFQWNDGPFQYAKLRIVPKQALYTGGTPTFSDFVGMKNADGSLVFGLQPANVLDAGATAQLVNTIYPTPDSPSANEVTVWTVQNPINSPALQQQAVSCASYAIPPHADQKGGAPPLDTGDVRVMNVVLRDGFLWASFVTQYNWEGDATNMAAVFWMQLDSSQKLVQQGVFGASGMHYFYPAIVPVAAQGCLMVFSRSSPNDYASLCAAGRKKGDKAGTFGPSAMIKSGLATYTALDGSGRNRWGDYSAVSPDPTDSGSGWIYGGFVSALNQWSTWVSNGKP